MRKMRHLMTQQRDIHKIQLLIFMQRLYAHLLILKYFELLSKRNSSGNKTTLLYPNGIQTTYTYDAKGDLIDIITQKAPSTGSGQATSTYKQTYQYDKTGNRTSYTEPSGIHTYTYDPFGRRIEKNISGQITTKYLYDNEDIIMEYAAIIPTNTNITTKYIHGPGIDEPLSMIRNNKTYYYHADALGSITRMTDQNGNTVQTIRYDTFGNIKSIKNPLLIRPYAFTGREYDIESGFYYLRNRYYDPRTGRFTTKDPIGFAGGDVNVYGYVDSVGKPFAIETNLYQYTGNNPINYIDPFGLDYIENGIIYNDAGHIIGELPLEAPNPFLDPINYLSGLGGVFGRNRILLPRCEGTGKSDLIIRWPRGYKTRFDITNPTPHTKPHIHWWTKQ